MTVAQVILISLPSTRRKNKREERKEKKIVHTTEKDGNFAVRKSNLERYKEYRNSLDPHHTIARVEELESQNKRLKATINEKNNEIQHLNREIIHLNEIVDHVKKIKNLLEGKYE